MGKKYETSCSVKRRNQNYCGICGSENLIIQGVIETQDLSKLNDKLVFKTSYVSPYHEYEYMFPVSKNLFGLDKEILNNIEITEENKKELKIDIWKHSKTEKSIENIYIVKCLDCKAIASPSKYSLCPSCNNNNERQMINFHYIFRPLWTRNDGKTYCTKCGYRK